MPSPSLPGPPRSPGFPLQAVAILALGLLLYVAFLGARDLWYPDEPDVAEPAREMLERGDLVTPTHNGRPWIDYPPLVYWCAIGSARLLGGLTELSLRLPSALAAIALALAVARFASARLSTAAGWIAALALMTFPHVAYQATNVHPDMLFALAQGAGLLLYAAAERWTGRRAWSARGAAFALFGLAFLAKGPLGLLLPGLILTLWHLSLGQVRRTLLLAPLALVALAVALPWYVALARAHGAGWVWQEFVDQNFARFAAGSERGHQRPWPYYLLRIWPNLGLWSLALPAAFLSGFRARFWDDPVRRLLLLWGLVPLVFLSLAATKREVYLLPAFPAYALWIGDLLAGARTLAVPWRRVGPDATLRWLAALGLTGAALGALVGLASPLLLPYLARTLPGLNDETRAVVAALVPAGLALGLLGLLVGGALLAALRRDRPRLALAGVVAVHAGLWLVGMGLVLPRLSPLNSYAAPGRWLAQRLAPEAPLGFLYPGKEVVRRAAFLYYGQHPLRMLQDVDDLAAFLAEDPKRLAVVDADLAEPLLRGDARFAGSERWRFEVQAYRWIVLGGA